MAAYPVKWLSDIKYDVTNELPDPENLINSSTCFYFDELEPIFALGTVKFFKMAACIRSHDNSSTNPTPPMDSLTSKILPNIDHENILAFSCIYFKQF